MIQDTSLEAYREIQAKLGNRQKQILYWIRRSTKEQGNVTNMELADAIGWSINRVTPRVYELRKKGKVVLDEKRRCTVTGRRACAWRVK